MVIKYTTIRLSKETKGKLDAIGKKGDSYERIILQLLTQANK